VNLAHVGYGVSQSLPVIVESVLAPKSKTLLLQQPEVHLHPRAQAALGSLFADLAKSGPNNFVIETHSDYLVDRVRIEVSEGRLDPERVQILFFERAGLGTTIYPLRMDASGNVLNPPPTFRDFFLREELRLLSRSK
jgi:predicted ATPase